MANAFIIGADKAFFPALNSILNSLDYIGFKQDVHLILFRDDISDYLDEAKEKFNFNIITHDFDEDLFQNTFEGNKIDYMKRYRYKVASDIVEKYNACCFCDTDLFFVRNVDLFFEIASNGIMVGAAKSGKIKYGDNPSYRVDGKDLLDKPFWNDKDICCCPIFFNKAFKQVFQDVFDAYTKSNKEDRFEASDLFAINSMILKNNAYDRLITMPCHSFVGTNETMLKPYTRVIEKEGQLISENGDLVYSVHGKWFSEGWHNGQFLHMDRLIEKYLGNKEYWTGQYKRAMQDIMKWFMIMSSGHKINTLDYSQYLNNDSKDFLSRHNPLN